MRNKAQVWSESGLHMWDLSGPHASETPEGCRQTADAALIPGEAEVIRKDGCVVLAGETARRWLLPAPQRWESQTEWWD